MNLNLTPLATPLWHMWEKYPGMGSVNEYLPMYRPSNGSFSVDVSKLSLVLPTRERSAGVAGASSSRLLDR